MIHRATNEGRRFKYTGLQCVAYPHRFERMKWEENHAFTEYYRVVQKKRDWDSGPILKIGIIFENIFKIFIICDILRVYCESFVANKDSVERQSIFAKKIWKYFLFKKQHVCQGIGLIHVLHWTKMIWTPFVQISIVAQRKLSLQWNFHHIRTRYQKLWIS